MRGSIKLTAEQGEVVSGGLTMALARRHLEQLVNAVLLTSGKRPHFEQEERWAALWMS